MLKAAEVILVEMAFHATPNFLELFLKILVLANDFVSSISARDVVIRFIKSIHRTLKSNFEDALTN